MATNLTWPPLHQGDAADWSYSHRKSNPTHAPKDTSNLFPEAIFNCWCFSTQRCVVLSTNPSPVSFAFCRFLENPFLLFFGWMGRDADRWGCALAEVCGLEYFLFIYFFCFFLNRSFFLILYKCVCSEPGPRLILLFLHFLRGSAVERTTKTGYPILSLC